jgi:hypothetical protein
MVQPQVPAEVCACAESNATASCYYAFGFDDAAAAAVVARLAKRALHLSES